MISSNAELAQLQRWLLAAITQPVAPTDNDLQQQLLPSVQQSAAQRLAVYRGAYLARLLDVLREQFPCTRFAVGDDLFDQLAAGYLQAHPPQSYTLAHLADNLVTYLEATRPSDWGQFVVELCRLEQAIDRVFDAPGPENLPPFTLPLAPGESLQLSLAPGLEILAFRYPVSTFYTGWKAGQYPPWPQSQPQFVALLRREYIVRRHELSPLQYELLIAIARGLPLGESIAAAVESPENPSASFQPENLRDWFASWAASGFFAAAH